jgi:hypothetical protein
MLDLQMNVQRGIDLIESCAWDRSMGRKSFNGPATSVDARDGSVFDGLAQLDARVQLTRSAFSGSEVPRFS